MPRGIGRGDGDEGSDVNVHIGFLDKDPATGRDKCHPYMRTGRRGKRVKNKGSIKDYNLKRYYLVEVPRNEDWLLRNIERQCSQGNYQNVDLNKPYIKVAIVKDPAGGDIADNVDANGAPDLDEHT